MKNINKSNVSKLVRQFTLENLTTERAYLNGSGWNDIKVDESFKDESIEQIVNLLGGRTKTKETIKHALKNTHIHNWFATRIVYEPLRNSWTYTAGQDYPSELATIRKELTK